MLTNVHHLSKRINDFWVILDEKYVWSIFRFYLIIYWLVVLSKHQLLTRATYCHICQISTSSRAIKKEPPPPKSSNNKKFAFLKIKINDLFWIHIEGALSFKKKTQEQTPDFYLEVTKKRETATSRFKWIYGNWSSSNFTSKNFNIKYIANDLIRSI